MVNGEMGDGRWKGGWIGSLYTFPAGVLVVFVSYCFGEQNLEKSSVAFAYSGSALSSRSYFTCNEQREQSQLEAFAWLREVNKKGPSQSFPEGSPAPEFQKIIGPYLQTLRAAQDCYCQRGVAIMAPSQWPRCNLGFHSSHFIWP